VVVCVVVVVYCDDIVTVGVNCVVVCSVVCCVVVVVVDGIRECVTDVVVVIVICVAVSGTSIGVGVGGVGVRVVICNPVTSVTDDMCAVVLRSQLSLLLVSSGMRLFVLSFTLQLVYIGDVVYVDVGVVVVVVVAVLVALSLFVLLACADVAVIGDIAYVVVAVAIVIVIGIDRHTPYQYHQQ